MMYFQILQAEDKGVTEEGEGKGRMRVRTGKIGRQVVLGEIWTEDKGLRKGKKRNEEKNWKKGGEVVWGGGGRV